MLTEMEKNNICMSNNYANNTVGDQRKEQRIKKGQ
jgi:hypothetical protein